MRPLALCVCGRVHFVDRFFGGDMLTCDEVPPDAPLWLINMKYFRVEGEAVRVPRPEATW